MIGVVTLSHLFASSPLNNYKKVVKDDNANHGWETSCKLLCAFEVKVCNKYVGSLAINFLALADMKALSV